MSYLISRVLAKPRLILGEMCRLYGKFVSYLRCVLCKTRLIFPRINGPNVAKCNLGIVNLETMLVSSFPNNAGGGPMPLAGHLMTGIRSCLLAVLCHEN